MKATKSQNTGFPKYKSSYTKNVKLTETKTHKSDIFLKYQTFWGDIFS